MMWADKPLIGRMANTLLTVNPTTFEFTAATPAQ
jgi:hypothetical protein